MAAISRIRLTCPRCRSTCVIDKVPLGTIVPCPNCPAKLKVGSAAPDGVSGSPKSVNKSPPGPSRPKSSTASGTVKASPAPSTARPAGSTTSPSKPIQATANKPATNQPSTSKPATVQSVPKPKTPVLKKSANSQQPARPTAIAPKKPVKPTTAAKSPSVFEEDLPVLDPLPTGLPMDASSIPPLSPNLGSPTVPTFDPLNPNLAPAGSFTSGFPAVGTVSFGGTPNYVGSFGTSKKSSSRKSRVWMWVGIGALGFVALSALILIPAYVFLSDYIKLDR